MPQNERLKNIVELVDQNGFLTVGDLSRLCQVSEMTIRRDLVRLEEENLVRRTYGGAASLHFPCGSPDAAIEVSFNDETDGSFLERVDVLVATSVNPSYDELLSKSVSKKKTIPVIAESLSLHNERTVVSVDNYQAARELGLWAARYAQEHWAGEAHILDLTFYLSNTQERSRGFIAGIRTLLPSADYVLSLDAQSTYETAYQLTKDVLSVHKNINLIFAINDTIARGALTACKELNIDPQRLIVLTFGLEGDSLKDALMAGQYCAAGLAMFPEIVGPTCIEAAIAAFNHFALPRQIHTPYVVLTAKSLPEYYQHNENGWQLRWEQIREKVSIPIEIGRDSNHPFRRLPNRIGFIVPFSEHEWYRNLEAAMVDYTGQLEIEFEVVDANQGLKGEIELRRQKIARMAADMVQPNEVILIDGGPIADYLAAALLEKQSITVITNSVPVFNILRQNANNILILTGGAYRHSSQVLVGPTAEGALRELRADKLFLMVTGITLDFGLSHTNISEVTIKLAMIHSAREVILLADHTFFGQESIIQVAPLSVVNKLVTDDALLASTRLELSKRGITVITASL